MLWIRKTIKKVIIVVPVFIMSCHVSLKPNTGPVSAQATMINKAVIKVTDLPAARAVHLVNRVNHDLDLVGLTFSPPYDFEDQIHRLFYNPKDSRSQNNSRALEHGAVLHDNSVNLITGWGA